MGKFIKNILLFTVLFSLTNIVGVRVWRAYANPYRFNEIFNLKYQYYREHKENYNTLFIGSSRTYRHINPQILDSVLQPYSIRSFNFGAPATFNPEALFLCESLLQQTRTGGPLKYIFLELTEFTEIADENSIAPRSYYYLDEAYLQLVSDYLSYRTDLDFLSRYKFMLPFVKGYVINGVRLYYPEGPDVPGYHLGKYKDGFYPLDVDLAINNSVELATRKRALDRDTNAIANAYVKNASPIDTPNNEGLSFLDWMMEKAESKNVRLFFIVPPRINNQRRFSDTDIPEFRERIIDMSSYNDYRELYLYKYSFDYGHLNSRGADIFSLLLADKIKHVIDASSWRK